MPLQPITLDRIDPDALKVVRRLVRQGFEAYLVGGVVRDLLVGRAPKDIDVATSATPEQMRKVFRNCRIIGRRFRLAQIFFGPKIIETATFRKRPDEVDVVANGADADGGERGDDDASDAPGSATDPAAASPASPEPVPPEPELLIRRDNVFGTAEEDARRRDFTINGLFFDVERCRVVDHVDGLADLEAGLVRSIGDPDVRFREDPVRILRAIRMSARLGFAIDPATHAAMGTHRGEISKCAAPRILEEFYRIFRSGAAVASLKPLRESGTLSELAPDLERALLDGATLDRGLAKVDASVERGATPGNAVLLSILTSALLPELYDATLGPHDALRVIEERFDALARRLVIPRRERERTRLILTAQRRLGGIGHNRRPMSLVRRDFFGEALFVFQAVAPERLLGQTERWRRLAAGEPVPAPESGPPGTGPGEPGRGRRRRRRRGRRHPLAGDVAVQ